MLIYGNRIVIIIIIVVIMSLMAASCDDGNTATNDAGIHMDASGAENITDKDSGASTDSGGDDDSGSDTDADVGGTYEWHTFYGSLDEVAAVISDKNGNIYLTGHSRYSWNGPEGQTPLNDFHGSDDLFILKLDKDGTYIWHTFYGSSYDGSIPSDPDYPGSDFGNGVVIDDRGSLYITGSSSDSWLGPNDQEPLQSHSGDGYFNIIVLKLYDYGEYQWHTFYGDTGGNSGDDIDVDNLGNIYVAGLSYSHWDGPDGQMPLHVEGGGGGENIILKLTGDGTYQWHAFYGSTDRPSSINIDDENSVYVTGSSDSDWTGPGIQNALQTYGGGMDLFVLKLENSGAYLWHTFYGSEDSDEGYAIETDSSGNIFVTGFSAVDWIGPDSQDSLNPDDNDFSLFILKLSINGEYLWHTFYGGVNMTLDEIGNVYVTGYRTANWDGPDGQKPIHDHNKWADLCVTMINNNGTYQWHTFYGSSKDDYGSDITVDEAGGIFVAGASNASWTGPGGQSPLNEYSGDSDITILKLRQ